MLTSVLSQSFIEHVLWDKFRLPFVPDTNNEIVPVLIFVIVQHTHLLPGSLYKLLQT